MCSVTAIPRVAVSVANRVRSLAGTPSPMTTSMSKVPRAVASVRRLVGKEGGEARVVSDAKMTMRSRVCSAFILRALEVTG